MTVKPNTLKVADTIRVVAPSLSFKIIADDCREIALSRFNELGLKVTFGKNIEKCNQFASSSIKDKVEDLHDAFSDKAINGIFAVIGGYNANEILPKLDYELIKNNPKFIIGYSDTTVLLNAIYAKTGIITYYGPAYSTMGMKKGSEYFRKYLEQVMFSTVPIEYIPSLTFSDDAWFLDQENRNFIPTKGPQIISKGKAEGTLIGGEMTSFQLLLGTPFCPSIKDSILFLEITEIVPDNAIQVFKRILNSIKQQKDFNTVKGIIIGRFERNLKIDLDQFISVMKEDEDLQNIPVVCNMDIGHTYPMITLPIGGKALLDTTGKTVKLVINS